MAGNDKLLKKCNFCGKPENKVQNMFSAGTANICDECVVYCYEMLVGNDLLNPQNSNMAGRQSRA